MKKVMAITAMATLALMCVATYAQAAEKSIFQMVSDSMKTEKKSAPAENKVEVFQRLNNFIAELFSGDSAKGLSLRDNKEELIKRKGIKN